MRVTSETRGAMVYLDEAFMGSTPVRRDGVEPGAHQLRVEKEGHVGWAKEIEVPAGATLRGQGAADGAARAAHAGRAPTAASLAVLAGLAGVVGIVLEALAHSPTTTASTRASAIADARLRYRRGLVGDRLLGAAAALALTAAVIVHRLSPRHLRRHARGAAADEARAVRPSGLAGLEVRW